MTGKAKKKKIVCDLISHKILGESIAQANCGSISIDAAKLKDISARSICEYIIANKHLFFKEYPFWEFAIYENNFSHVLTPCIKMIAMRKEYYFSISNIRQI